MDGSVTANNRLGDRPLGPNQRLPAPEQPYSSPAVEVSLATVPAARRERLAAWAVVIVSGLAFAIAAPLARMPLGEVPAFIPSYEAALTLNDLITAVLLFGTFARLRSRALLMLASGYLFDALMIVPHALSFPGAFAPGGLLGAGPQTTAWLYVFWHAGFPLFVLAYALLATSGRSALRGRVTRAAASAIGMVVVLVVALTLLATAGRDHLTDLVRNGDYSMLVTKGVSPIIWLLSLAALAALWRRRHTSVLDLWLMVVMWAWLLDIALSAVIGSSRFDLGWYAGRSYGLLAASFVLATLLLETNGLHIKLARARAQIEDHAKQLEDRVRERTVELERAAEALRSETAERLQTQAQLVQAQKMDALGTLAGGIAHDLNNTLVPVLGLTKLMIKRHPENSRDHTSLAMILQAGERARDLVRRILAFTRKDAPIRERVDLASLVRDSLKMIRSSLPATIDIAEAIETVPPVLGDPGQLHQIVLNLVVNAAQAIGDGMGTIAVATRTEHFALPLGDGVGPPVLCVGLTVSDSGCGMDAATMQRVFEPFFTTKPVGEGTGLGLSVVHSIVAQHGGRATVESRVGQGTRFDIYLPALAATEGGQSVGTADAAE
jgi:signal transduction histidine kinase